jgi:zinc D-Ala-D-Ala dipeptidase
MKKHFWTILSVLVLSFNLACQDKAAVALAARGESTIGRAHRYCRQDQGARRRRCGDIVDDEQRRYCLQYLCAQRVLAAQGHLLRWRSSTMFPHRLRRSALHLPLRRPERDLLYFHHGLLAQAPPKPAPSGPPTGGGPYRPSDLVELVKLDPTIKLDIRYATANNFVGKAVYPEARAFLQRPVAKALLSAHRWLKGQGYGVLIYDAYRPWTITKLFWDITPSDKKVFVADPSIGSVHNRGCAVDLGLCDLRTGREVEMPSAYDDMTDHAFVTYSGGTPEQRAHRDLLRKAMEREGFFVYPEEWWHYDFKDFREYAVQDIPFSAIVGPARSK